MSRRSDQRRAAVFALYQSELTGRALDDVFERGAPTFTRALAHATADNQEELDVQIARHSEGWALDRIAPLERAIMRVALLENDILELEAASETLQQQNLELIDRIKTLKSML